jgi:hypothetical protein
MNRALQVDATHAAVQSVVRAPCSAFSGAGADAASLSMMARGARPLRACVLVQKVRTAALNNHQRVWFGSTAATCRWGAPGNPCIGAIRNFEELLSTRELTRNQDKCREFAVFDKSHRESSSRKVHDGPIASRQHVAAHMPQSPQPICPKYALPDHRRQTTQIAVRSTSGARGAGGKKGCMGPQRLIQNRSSIVAARTRRSDD